MDDYPNRCRIVILRERSVRPKDLIFEQARLRSLAMLKTGFDLGTQGERPSNREDLHER